MKSLFFCTALLFQFSESAHAVLYTNDSQTRIVSGAEDKSKVVSFHNTIFFIDKNIAVTAAHTAIDGVLTLKDSAFYVEKVYTEFLPLIVKTAAHVIVSC